MTEAVEKAVDKLQSTLAIKPKTTVNSQLAKWTRTVANYELAWAAAGIFAAKEMLEYPERLGKKDDEIEGKLARFFVADALEDLCGRLKPTLLEIGLTENEAAETLPTAELAEFIRTNRNEAFASEIATAIAESGNYGEYGLNEEQQMMMESFRSFAEDQVCLKLKRCIAKTHRT